MRVLVCGGRDFGYINLHKPSEEKEQEYKFIFSTLNDFARENSDQYNETDNWLPNDLFIIAGGARGVDTAAIDWAIIYWVTYQEYYADWEKYGKAAGAIRNKQMLDEGKPDVVIAFPGGKGTANMIKQAEERGIKVIRVTRG
jgi:hypothetical protein